MSATAAAPAATAASPAATANCVSDRTSSASPNMVDTASVRPSADVKNVGQEVEKQVKVRDGWLPVIVSHVLSPDEIYVQNAAPSTQTFLHSLMSDLSRQTELSSRPSTADCWKVGAECVAQRDDQRWYRAKISDVCGDQFYRLKFNDYGYTEWVSAECMRPIRREFLEVTWQAQKCRLVDIFPLLGDAWPQDTCEQFQMLIGGKTCSIEIKGESENNVLAVDVWLKDVIRGTALTCDEIVYHSVSAMLVDKQLARPGPSLRVDVSHRDGLLSRHSPSSLSSPHRSVVPSAASQQPANMASSLSPPQRHRTSSQPANLMPSGQQDTPSASNWRADRPVYPPRDDDVWTERERGRKSAARPAGVSASGWSQGDVVPLQADFKPCGTPRCTNMSAVTTHVDEQCYIYVHELHGGDVNELVSLDARLQARYTHLSPDPDVTWSLGSAVAAYYDGMFYRAKIVGFDDDGIEVEYVDYGNREPVCKDHLRVLDAEFMADPVHCYCCRLHDVVPIDSSRGWTSDCIDLIRKLIMGNNCTLSIKEIRSDGVLMVEVYLSSSVSLGDLLCNKEHATRPAHVDVELYRTPDGNSEPSDDDQTYYAGDLPRRQLPCPYASRMLPGIDDYLFVTVTQIDSPAVVYLQHTKQSNSADDPRQTHINAELDRLLSITDRYNVSAQDFPPLADNHFCAGSVCVAQYSIDSCFYRAEIISLDSDNDDDDNATAAVRFVDYGSFERVPRHRLREIPADDVTLPSQAMRSHLTGVSPGRHVKLSDVIQAMWKLLACRPLLAVVKGVSYYDEEITVDLYDESEWRSSGVNTELVYQSLIDRQLMTHTAVDEASYLDQASEISSTDD